MNGFKQVQSEISECGLGCLSICSSILGAEISLSTLMRRYPSSQRGMNLVGLIEVAGAMDMRARAIRCDFSDVDLKAPAILHWRMNHFVVLEKYSKSKCHPNDLGCFDDHEWQYDDWLGSAQGIIP